MSSQKFTLLLSLVPSFNFLVCTYYYYCYCYFFSFSLFGQFFIFIMSVKFNIIVVLYNHITNIVFFSLLSFILLCVDFKRNRFNFDNAALNTRRYSMPQIKAKTNLEALKVSMIELNRFLRFLLIYFTLIFRKITYIKA